jgi:dolichyl-phosphate-mannose--protein O-mannosyl transferase
VKERPAYEGTVDQGSRRMGIAAVVVLTAIIAIVVVVMSFSTVNTPMSVDGDENVRSQWFSSESGD